METLRLGFNRFTGLLPASWGSFKALTELALTNNQLQGSVPPSWSALGTTPLEVLGLSNNSGLVGCLPRGLERFEKKDAVCQGTRLKCSVC
jgi:hypothetical protein